MPLGAPPMANSNEIRRLTAKWKSGTGWPKRLEWLKIAGLRGWTGQQFKLDYPIMAPGWENRCCKTTANESARHRCKRITAPNTLYQCSGVSSNYFSTA